MLDGKRMFHQLARHPSNLWHFISQKKSFQLFKVLSGCSSHTLCPAFERRTKTGPLPLLVVLVPASHLLEVHLRTLRRSAKTGPLRVSPLLQQVPFRPPRRQREHDVMLKPFWVCSHVSHRCPLIAQLAMPPLPPSEPRQLSLLSPLLSPRLSPPGMLVPPGHLFAFLLWLAPSWTFGQRCYWRGSFLAGSMPHRLGGSLWIFLDHRPCQDDELMRESGRPSWCRPRWPSFQVPRSCRNSRSQTWLRPWIDYKGIFSNAEAWLEAKWQRKWICESDKQMRTKKHHHKQVVLLDTWLF